MPVNSGNVLIHVHQKKNSTFCWTELRKFFFLNKDIFLKKKKDFEATINMSFDCKFIHSHNPIEKFPKIS